MGITTLPLLRYAGLREFLAALSFVLAGAIAVTACAQENWMQQAPATHPSARSEVPMAYDSVRQQVVLFGGNVYSACPCLLNDTWVWDGTNWIQKAPAAAPSVRRGHVMVFDELRQQVVLFGGVTLTGSGGEGGFLTLVGDTWVWDGTNWIQKFPVTSPPARVYAAIAYDATRHEVVLFGGLNDTSLLGDTWVWDGSNWSPRSPATAPSTRENAAMTYDRVRQEVILFGGDSEKPNGDANSADAETWIWDGSSWTQKFPATVPAGRNSAGFAYDTAHQQSVLFGGWGPGKIPLSERADTWAWDGSDWAQLTPAASPHTRAEGALAYDGARQQIVLFGGDSSTLNPGFITDLSDTWLFGVSSASTPVTITVPAGIQFTFNGTTYTGSQALTVAPGTYALSTPITQPAGVGTQAAFVSWSDGGAAAHQVTVGAAALTITGTFKTQFLLATQGVPPAGGLVAPVTGYFDQGTRVNLTASPSATYAFVSWSGDCSGSGACSVFMNAPRSVSAFFTNGTMPVTINVPPGLMFTLNGITYTGPQTIWFPGISGPYLLSTASPQATGPGAQAAFVAWSDGGAQAHTLAVGRVPLIITGTFRTQYLLTATAIPANEGSVNLPPGGPYYDAGTVVSVTPVANPGFGFQFWGGACTLSGACSITMNAPQSVVAHFVVAENWVQVLPAVTPGARNSHATAYDAARQNTFIFGGSKPLGLGGGPLNDFWTWDGTLWTQRNNASPLLPVPSPRYDPDMVYDSARQVIVMFGGGVGTNVPLDDTWVWNGSDWIQKFPVTRPPGRIWPAMAYDAARKQVVMFGGYGQNGTLLGDTWVWDGTNWTKRVPAASPPPRHGHRMAFDAARQRVVLHGGTGNMNYNDTWVWDGGTWTEKFPTTIPPGFPNNFGMTYDVLHQNVIMFGGNLTENQTWIWDGANWILKAPVTSPTARTGNKMCYDGARQQVVMFGGVVPTANLGDTWLWF